jgi:hypothetical protein
MSASRRSLAGLALGLWLLLVAGPAVAAGDAGPLRISLSGVGGARLAGDHETVTVTVTNAGAKPLQDVLVMLSLADVSGSPAVPLGLEDWTPAPEAAHAATLAQGEQLTGTWRLRMIQAAQLAVFATAVTGSDRSVTNSRPLILSIGATHSLTPWTVLPVALSVPLAVLGGGGALLWRRRRVAGR